MLNYKNNKGTKIIIFIIHRYYNYMQQLAKKFI